MEFKKLINLFSDACNKNDWGEESYILTYDDGSGEVVSEDKQYDGDVVFEFDNEEELIEKLEKSLK